MTNQNSPYSQIEENDILIRTFTQDINEDELVWHRDRRDRKVTVLKETDWKLQFDNELPQVLKDVIFIPKNTYHRVIKGTGELNILIQEF